MPGLVRSERRGRWVYYELDPAALRELAAALDALATAAEKRATRPRSARGERAANALAT